MDVIGNIIGILVIGGIGVLFCILGWLIWKREKIESMHDYHFDKVSTCNKSAFCKLSGIGLLITAVILGITDSVYSFISFTVCFVVGLVMLVTAGNKYNR